MTMVSMKLDPKEAKETAPCAVEAGDRPEYPWGLELRLEDGTLTKLGMETPPAVGSEMIITARVMVTSASAHQTQGGDAHVSSCWQITEMEVAPAVKDPSEAANKLYTA